MGGLGKLQSYTVFWAYGIGSLYSCVDQGLGWGESIRYCNLETKALLTEPLVGVGFGRIKIWRSPMELIRRCT